MDLTCYTPNPDAKPPQTTSTFLIGVRGNSSCVVLGTDLELAWILGKRAQGVRALAHGSSIYTESKDRHHDILFILDELGGFIFVELSNQLWP